MTNYDKVDTDVVPIMPLPDLGPRSPCLIVMRGGAVGQMYRVTDGAILGRDEEAPFRVEADGVSRRHVSFQRVGDNEVYLVDLGSTNGTQINGERISAPTLLRDGDRISLGASFLLKFTYHDALEAEFQEQMFDAALRDGLTGLYNRRYLDELLDAEFAFARRHKVALTVCMLDIDHFKRVNDTYGHSAGDEVLRTLGAQLNDTIRQEDTCCRYGGEEFVVVSLGIPLANGVVMAERLRKRISDQAYTWEDQRISLTVSLGVAGFPYDTIETPTNLLAAADQALYLAKQRGRNRTKVFITD